MELTSEQAAVVALSSGRHLVLAPPGSGKTEMLSRRIIGAVESGVDPARMLCATFTNRAAFEMRDRVQRDGGDLQLPEVGNLHHFCHSFLLSVGRIHPGKHVLDEVQQQEFIKEIVDKLKREMPPGRARDVLESYLADAFKNERNPYAEILSGAGVVRQRRIGIPSPLVRPFPRQVAELASEDIISNIERSYTGLKRKFMSVDFDDLLNETYMFLEAHPLPEEKRFTWVQVDEVQDLSPLQWHIVKNLAASNAVCVYFGDFEQAIFSFLGASADSLLAATADCERHFFKKNFRATPILLEVLMRYSLDALASEWEFLPAPADPEAPNGMLGFSVERLEGERGGIHPGFKMSPIVDCADRMLKSGTAENVAILVRTNKAADLCESWVKMLGWRYAKVSGVDLFSYAPMRDFMAFVSLFTEHVPMTAWAVLARRFSRTMYTRAYARYFVRGMFASRWNPEAILGEGNPVGLVPSGRSRSALWAWRNRKAIQNMRRALRPAVLEVESRLNGRLSFKSLFNVFSRIALDGPMLYKTKELSPKSLVDGDGKATDMPYEEGVRIAKERIEKFLRYADHVYAEDARPFGQILAEDWSRLSKLKEADLLVGDEKIVISTIHKAKGRQFDAVFIPNVKDVAACSLSDRDEARRLLYVAMSRAKRHLFLWESGEDSVEPLRQCFEPGYESYYVRKARGVDLTGEWLAEWERLAEMNMRRKCDDKTVSAATKSAVAPLVRMAIGVLKWSEDSELRRTVYLDVMKSDKTGDTSYRAIECLSDCRMFSDYESAVVRNAALLSESTRVARAALGYFTRMSESSRDAAVDAMGDFIYSRFPEIRASAAARLFDLGVIKWVKIVTGAKSDFERLAKRPDPEHEESIRTILASDPNSDRYASRLRDIIASRALRG